MRWFRANRAFGGRLALFALALQLILSFDHIHPEDIYGAAPLGGSSASTALPAVAEAKSAPAGLASHHGDDYCLICATTSLLNNSFAAAAPQLPLPAAVHGVEHADRVAVVLITPRRAPFQSRAPPQA